MDKDGEEADGSGDAPSWSPVARERLSNNVHLSDYVRKRKQETTRMREEARKAAEEKVEDDNVGSLEQSKDEEPRNKREKATAKSSGLAWRIGQSIQRSISFRTGSRPQPITPVRTRQKASSFPRRKKSLLWSDTVDNLSQDMSANEIKRQEVIYELTQGEQQLIDDLRLVKKVYYEPMLKLDIMTESELGQIFGTLDSLIPLHEELLTRLEGLRSSEKTVEEVGPTLLTWFPCLDAYITYCCNQVHAKALLDQKKQDRRVEQFLRLCQESSFSRKLDLWNFLDLPRSRLVKYPLLLKEILKSTAPEHPDQDTISEAMDTVQGIILEVDRKTGEAECQFYRRGLSYPEEGLRLPEIQLSRFLYCQGELRSHRGQKLHVFLFELALVLTRPSSSDRDGQVQFHVCYPPLPAAHMLLEDLPDGDPAASSFFLTFITAPSPTPVKNCFRVSSRGRSGCKPHSHTLQASDSFNKQQWISCLRQAIVQSRDRETWAGPGGGACPDPLNNIAELSLDSDVEMQDQ